MKGNQKIIDKLNTYLSDELTGIMQYIVQAEMCENWGYKKLHTDLMNRAKEEMKHTEMLIGRILFLEGKPVVGKIGKVSIGESVGEFLKNDFDGEQNAVNGYNEGIALASQLKDNGTKELLEKILLDEEKHTDDLETEITQMDQLGVENFLVEQMD